MQNANTIDVMILFFNKIKQIVGNTIKYCLPINIFVLIVLLQPLSFNLIPTLAFKGYNEYISIGQRV